MGAVVRRLAHPGCRPVALVRAPSPDAPRAALAPRPRRGAPVGLAQRSRRDGLGGRLRGLGGLERPRRPDCCAGCPRRSGRCTTCSSTASGRRSSTSVSRLRRRGVRVDIRLSVGAGHGPRQPVRDASPPCRSRCRATAGPSTCGPGAGWSRSTAWSVPWCPDTGSAASGRRRPTRTPPGSRPTHPRAPRQSSRTGRATRIPPSVTADEPTVPHVVVATGDYALTVRYRNRETGMYDGAPVRRRVEAAAAEAARPADPRSRRRRSSGPSPSPPAR